MFRSATCDFVAESGYNQENATELQEAEMPFTIIRDEIARQSADVVVVPANTSLAIDGGAGLAVGHIAGISKLQAACYRVGSCEVGHAVATHAFDFPAKRIVHAVGPEWDGSDEARSLLEQAYASALAVADDCGAQSIAMPLLSSGAQGCPPETSLHIALSQVRPFLSENPDTEVRIVLFGTEATDAGKKLFPGLEEFVDDSYVAAHDNVYGQSFGSMPMYNASQQCAHAPAAAGSAPATRRGAERGEGILERIGSLRPSRRSRRQEKAAPAAEYPSSTADEAVGSWSLDEFLNGIDAPFSTTLLALIDERGLDDSEVYRRANLSRQHFSKIRSNPSYQPTKKTVLALAVALELTVDETEDLLKRAGLAFSPASKADLIVKWFIERGDYDIFAINEALYAYDQQLLG